MIIHRKRLRIFALVKQKRRMIFDVLKNIHVLAANALKNFRLEFAVHKIRELHFDFEIRPPKLIDTAVKINRRSLHIVIQIGAFNQLIFFQLVTLGKRILFETKTMLINMLQVNNHLISKNLTTRAGNHSKPCRF